MKICVYAICKNEEKFVDRWYESMSEADAIYVMDTGSTDNTVSLLRDKGVNVSICEVKPWRFDVARNLSLELVPLDTDICVCTDLDEVFKPGWRRELENSWVKGTNRFRYIYNWSIDDNDNPIVSFYYEKIHDRKNYKWVNPVHEILDCSLLHENYAKSDKVILNHYPDRTKSRSSYLPLLEVSVKENPLNDRNMHYLGREYMYNHKWNECIDTLIRHLKLESATWRDERCASMRFIARSYINLERYDEAKIWLLKAIDEAPYLRDPYVEMALLCYCLEDYIDVIKYCSLALKIKEYQMTYINEVFSWDNTIDDLLSISYYKLGLYDIALFYIDRALKYDKNDERLIRNRKIFDSLTKEKS